MTRLVINLLTGFATISLASSFKNCYDHNIYLCGDTCSAYGKTCDCGEKWYEMNYVSEFVCISNSDCILDYDGM